MNHFTFSRFTFSIRAETPFHLPGYKGSAVRGGFGYAFRRAVCASRRKECSECLLRQTCAYFRVFETPFPKDTRIMRKYVAALRIPSFLGLPESGLEKAIATLHFLQGIMPRLYWTENIPTMDVGNR